MGFLAELFMTEQGAYREVSRLGKEATKKKRAKDFAGAVALLRSRLRFVRSRRLGITVQDLFRIVEYLRLAEDNRAALLECAKIMSGYYTPHWVSNQATMEALRYSGYSAMSRILHDLGLENESLAVWGGHVVLLLRSEKEIDETCETGGAYEPISRLEDEVSRLELANKDRASIFASLMPFAKSLATANAMAAIKAVYATLNGHLDIGRIATTGVLPE